MTNRLHDVQVSTVRLSPAAAEVWIRARADQVAASTELRGRLVGPRSLYASTIEVAYPLRPPGPGHAPPAEAIVEARVVIPEPCLWTPETPFLYEGPVELWHDGTRCGRVELRHALRTLRLGPAGLRVNGVPRRVRGVVAGACSDAHARELHQAGRDTLYVPLRQATSVGDVADRHGFLFFVQLGSLEEMHTTPFPMHPCCLGCVASQDVAADEAAWRAVRAWCGPAALGLELTGPPRGPLPEGTAFLVCPDALLLAVADCRLPTLVRTASGTEVPPGSPEVPLLGVLHSP